MTAAGLTWAEVGGVHFLLRVGELRPVAEVRVAPGGGWEGWLEGRAGVYDRAVWLRWEDKSALTPVKLTVELAYVDKLARRVLEAIDRG